MQVEEKDIQTNENPAKKLGTGLIVSIVLISLLSGTFAGLGAGWYAARNHAALNLSNQRPTEVSEDSAVIDVVKAASPAVVSIIISKDLNQQQQNSFFNSPFFFDPFFQNQQQQTPQNTTPNFQQTGAGSGFLISPDGLILTNKHVVGDTSAKYTVITSDGQEHEAKVLSVDPVNDLALVKIDVHGAPILKFADSSRIQIGQKVIAIGNSLGQYSNTVTSGIVSGIGRNITAGGEGSSEQLEGVIQTDAAINPGNSGGPLLNIFGEVIGVNTAIDQQGQLVGFAIPANDAQKAVQSYNKYGKIVRPFLGIRYVLITPAIKEQNKLSSDSGAWVTSGPDASGNNNPGVIPGSAADKAGVKDGDIILSINGDKIDQNNSLASIVRNYNPGDIVDLLILRNGKQQHIKVTLDESK